MDTSGAPRCVSSVGGDGSSYSGGGSHDGGNAAHGGPVGYSPRPADIEIEARGGGQLADVVVDDSSVEGDGPS